MLNGISGVQQGVSFILLLLVGNTSFYLYLQCETSVGCARTAQPFYILVTEFFNCLRESGSLLSACNLFICCIYMYGLKDRLLWADGYLDQSAG